MVAHGAEITVLRAHAREPRPRRAGCCAAPAAVVAAGYLSARRRRELAAGRPLAGVVIPPGVDVDRFRPLDAEMRAATRRRFGLDPDRPLVLGVSRLVPRKGFDVVIDAVAGRRLDPGVQLAIAGAGRDRRRLERGGRTGRVRFLGALPDADLPALYACADVFAMCCRDRWGGLEAEGSGSCSSRRRRAACPRSPDASGGSHEAVVDGETGFVVAPRDVDAVRDAIARARRRRGAAGPDGRGRAPARGATSSTYDRLVARLAPLARGDLSAVGPLCR